MDSISKKAYITTPIYYVNDVPHIGHAYTTVIADTMARFSRLKGLQTFFLTGTDEHGQKIEQAAKSRDKSPQQYADEISGKFRELWDAFDITYDKFIRTTDDEHKIGVQKAFEKMFAKGDIYKGEYEGHYCVSCETFFTKTQLLDEEACPDCGKLTNMVKEESYFFALSRYQEQLLEWYKLNEHCILPKSKKNEVINFVKGGLQDLSITRTSFDWGVKLPTNFEDPKHVMYVWLDALLNYITALGYGSDNKNLHFWPADTQLVGKDILRFHAIFWPAFLLSLDLPLPKHIGAHGWWTRNGEKMSKSKGNVVNPKEVADAYGLDSFRYFMLREVPFGQDGDFSQKALIDRINGDLSNDLGNLLNRLIGMAGKYFDHKIDSSEVASLYKEELAQSDLILDSLDNYIYEMQFNRYLEELWKLLSLGNGAITAHEPWTMMKNGLEKEAMGLIALIANLLARVALKIYPVMPQTANKLAASLSITIDTPTYKNIIEEKNLLDPFVIQKTEPLFPKVEEEILETPQPSAEAQEEEEANLITIDQFFQSEIKVATVIEAISVEGSSKLLQLQVDVGENKPRQIIAGIAKFYTPEDLIGSQVCIVANLKPAKLMGLISEGMVLAAKSGKKLSLIQPSIEVKNGSAVG
jgi:methionyl-tRNA synthetase